MFLKDLINEYQIYIDTSALMNVEKLKEFIDKNETSYYFRNKIIILANVHQELMDLSTHKNKNKSTKASRALELIKNSCLFDIKNEYKRKIKPFADPKILSTLIENKEKQKQILITFDNKLANAIYDINKFECLYQINNIKVMKFNDFGELIEYSSVKKPNEKSQLNSINAFDYIEMVFLVLIIISTIIILTINSRMIINIFIGFLFLSIFIEFLLMLKRIINKTRKH